MIVKDQSGKCFIQCDYCLQEIGTSGTWGYNQGVNQDKTMMACDECQNRLE